MPGIDDRKRMSILFSVVGIVLLFVSFVLPWWGHYRERDGEASGFGYGISISTGLEIHGSGTSFYTGGVTKTVYFVAAILIILALICAALMATNLILDSIRGNIDSNLSMQFGVLALVFCLLAPIMFMITLPMALRTDAEREAEEDGEEYEVPDHDDPTKSFFGSREEEEGFLSGSRTTRINWGGDIGWILSFVSSIFLAISVIMIRSSKKEPLSPQAQPVGPAWPESQPSHPVRYGSPPPPPPPSV
jgi:hypothetical protein